MAVSRWKRKLKEMKFVSFLETPVSFYGHLLSAATKKICIFGGHSADFYAMSFRVMRTEGSWRPPITKSIHFDRNL